MLFIFAVISVALATLNLGSTVDYNEGFTETPKALEDLLDNEQGSSDDEIVRKKRFEFHYYHRDFGYDDFNYRRFYFCGYNRFGEIMHTDGFNVRCYGTCPSYDYGRCFNY